MIVTTALKKSYGRELVLDDVTLTIPAGGVTSLIGPNGAGKSTLLSIIARLLASDGGQVFVDGLNVAETPGDLLARRLSILRQDNAITARLTVRDLVAFGRYPYSKGRLTADDREHVERALCYLDIEPLAERFIDELSGGQRQRAFVAMVLCQDTDYVLLDEPLNSLDMRHANLMMKMLRRAADDLGKTIVLVLHDINFASWYSDRIIAMRDGKVRHIGGPDDIIRPDILKDIYGMDMRVIEIDGRRIGLFYG